MSDLEAVLALARNAPVFPCRRHPETLTVRGKDKLYKPKSPLTEHGFEDASQEEWTIREWFARYPECLWGVPTGSGAGLVAIDYDTEKADDTAREWITAHAEALMATRTHSTLSGGRHYLFRSQERYSSGVCVTLDGVKRIGIDIRAEGGYIVWWPLEGLPVAGEGALPLPDGLLTDRTIETRNLPPLSQASPESWRRDAHKVADVLAYHNPEDYDEWIGAGMSIHAASAGSDDGFKLWSAWSSGELTGESPRNYSGLDDLRYRWESFSTDKPREKLRGIGSLIAAAKARGYTNGATADESPPHSDDDRPRDDGREEPPFEAYWEPEAEKEPEPAAVLPLVWYGDIEGPASYEQMVRGLLLKGSFFVVYGESNSGKTFFILDLALCIAQGRLWRGQRTRGGLVLYVAGEGAASVRNRVAAYRKANPETAGSMPFAIVPLAVDFMSLESVHKLMLTIRAAEAESGQKVALVVVDTLARAMAGGEENSTQDMGLVVSCADYIRQETGAAVGFVHHTGKDASKGARGSSALRAATDTEIMIENTTGPRNVLVMKQRDLEMGPPVSFTLETVEIGSDPDDFMPITSCVVKHGDGSAPVEVKFEVRGKNQKTMLAALRSREKSNPSYMWTIPALRDLGRELGMTKTTIYSTVDSLLPMYFTPSVGGYLFTDGNRQ